ncbi:hypothetical protein GSI_07312 [Ganoderma sinense ZZ0214-1]|uniref:F-box domain-containing protein n=1 Tax=Ganoderma sinense ZZ0214-1 TaxID=1077348 RepID=A0A2G8SA45_9APHY|nr:hypothetical protein GSI_07312 [Ganoderma sinense ZZ0214-1]
MKLPYDALLHVISSFSYSKDAIQLIATCRVLYHEGPKIALKKAVIISTEKQLALFLKFLLADNSSRCRYLKQLELRPCFSEQDAVQELVETVPLLTSLEYLKLFEVDALLDLHPNLLSAFCALTTLRHINFTGLKADACGFLSGIRSPLISASFDFLPEDGQKLWYDLSDDEWVQFHPANLLGNFAPTLEELQCVAWYTDYETVTPTTVFPNMRKLSIELHEFPLRIDPFIRAFPHLTDLRLNTDYHSGRYSDDMRNSHVTNVAQQLDPVSSCGTWEHLEHVRGCLFDIYAVGITFHIRWVTIVDSLDDGPKTEMLATVLRYARLLHLKIEGVTGALLGDADRGFIAMLRHASVSGLLNLDVCVYFGENDREKDLAAVIESLVSTLAGLSLKFLELRFVTRDLDPTPESPGDLERMMARQRGLPEPPDPTPAPLTPAELSLQTLDMDVLISRLEAMPSLEAAHVVLHGSRYCGWEGHDRTISKGGAWLAVREQWESWIPGMNRIVL